MGLPKQRNSTNQKVEQDKPQVMMVKFQNVMNAMHRMHFTNGNDNDKRVDVRYNFWKDGSCPILVNVWAKI